MNEPRVTVITTLYNVAEYLPRFFECLNRQTYTDYKLLILDDGSEDNTLEICRSQAERDPRIEIIHTEHRGLTPARITSIASVRTPFSVSMDGDDVYEPGYLEHLMNARDKYDADLVISRVIYRDESYKKTGEFARRGELLITRGDFQEKLPMLLEDRRLNYMYAKIFRTELLQQCHADEDITLGEDTIYCCQYLTKADSLVLIDDPDTNYIQYTSRSLTSQHGKDEFQKLCRVNRTITEILGNAGLLSDDVQRVIDGRVFQSASWILNRITGQKLFPAADSEKIVYDMFHSDMYEEAYRRQEQAGNLKSFPFKVTDPGNVWAFKPIMNDSILAGRPTMSGNVGDGCIPQECRIIVTMTSYPGRIGFVPEALKSIYSQTRKADEVILWLAEEQFPGRERDLPEELVRDSEEGRLTIRWCDDLKSHKKYFYAFQEFRNDLVITVDDDLVFSPSMIETLYRSFLFNPNAVSAARAHLIVMEGDSFLPYEMWPREYAVRAGTPSVMLHSTSGAGTLHPVFLYDLEALDKKAIFENCLYADDIWLKLMQLVSGIPVVVPQKYEGMNVIPGSQEPPETLYKYNKTMNDEQLQKSIAWFDSKYGDGFIFRKLRQKEEFDFGGKAAVLEHYEDRIADLRWMLKKETTRLKKEKEEREKELRDIQNSVSFRTGRIMTKPGRALRDLIKKWKK